MPVKNTSEISRSIYDPGPDVLSITLPHHSKLELHGSKNGSLDIRRKADGGAEISCCENIHEWGKTETIRLDPDAWAVVQAFVAGGSGDSWITPYQPFTLE